MNVKTLQEYMLKLEEKPWVWFLLLFAVILAFHGKPVPYINEYLYLLRLKTDHLTNDWTFSVPANEHWLFNTIFAFPARFVSIEVIGWIGRLTVWTICILGLMKIGRLLSLLNWQIAIAIIIWVASDQGAINVEWIFGGFEAKTVAYCFLLFALAGFAKGSIILPSILLGLSFSFHPAVGLWAIGGVGIALLLQRTAPLDLIKSAALIIAFASPMLIRILMYSDITPASVEDWKFLVNTVFPHHLNPSEFDKRHIIWLFIMLVFNIATTWNSENFAVKFFRNFQIALWLFFAGGILLWLFELYPLLGYMPMRLFPLFVTLLFLFTAFAAIPRLESRTLVLAAAMFVAFVIGVHDPSRTAVPELRRTISSWRKQPDDLEKAYNWVSLNTPQTAVIISPPIRIEVWYYSNRATIAAYRYPAYDRLSEWRTRIKDLTNNVEITNDNATAIIENAFSSLSENEVINLQQKYGATHLISKSEYSFPVLFETETYKVYDLSNKPQ